MDKRFLSYLIIGLIIASITSIALISVHSRINIANTITIVLDKSALEGLGLRDTYSVASVTLTIPAVGIVEPAKIQKTDEELVIIFDGLEEYENKIISYYQKGPGSRLGYVPSVYILLRDYNINTQYYIILSSYTQNVIDYMKRTNRYMLTVQELEHVRETTMKDKLSILEANRIQLSEKEINILKSMWMAGTEPIPQINNEKLIHLGFHATLDSSSSLKITFLEEYPYPGTHIYQEVNWTKYHDLTSDIPRWWSERYVERGDSDDYVEEYQRFVKDLMASRYYAEKSYYDDLNELIDTLRDLIVEGKPNPADLPDNYVDLEVYVGLDEWRDSKEGQVDYKDIPLFRYYVDNHISADDAGEFTMIVVTSYDSVVGAVSGLMYGGTLITTGYSINITRVFIERDNILSNESARMGTLWLRNTAVSYGSDVILIEWIIDSTSSDDYYIITPIVTVTPLYSINYDSESFDFTYSSDTDPFYDDWSSDSLAVTELYITAERDPESLPVKLWEMEVSKESGSGEMNYKALIDTPPFIGIIVDMMSDELNHPAVKLLTSVYSTLSSVGYVQANITAEALTIYAKLQQYDELSKDVEVSLVMYNSQAKSMMEGNEYRNLVIITLTYPSTSPPCGGGWCATNTTVSGGTS